MHRQHARLHFAYTLRTQNVNAKCKCGPEFVPKIEFGNRNCDLEFQNLNRNSEWPNTY